MAKTTMCEMCSTTLRSGVFLLTVLVASAVVTAAGCTGVPDRSQEARQLESSLSAMPGVTGATVVYSNDFENGRKISVTLSLPTATRQQVVDVVNTLNRVRGGSFSDYRRQEITYRVQAFAMECSAVDANGDPLDADAMSDADALADEVVALQKLSTTISAEMGWASCGGDNRTLTLRGAESSVPQVLAAVQAADLGLTEVDMGFGSSETSVMNPLYGVTLRLPVSLQDWERVKGLVLGLDATPRAVELGPGPAIRGLTVGVKSPASAYQQLSTTITQLGGRGQNRLLLEWELEDRDRETPNAKKFEGSVDIGGCEYRQNAMSEQQLEEFFTPEALEVKRRLRELYDTCP